MSHLSFFSMVCIGLSIGATAVAQTVDYSVISVAEESGLDFVQVTSENDYVCMPIVKRSTRSFSWLTNRIIDISRDGESIAYLSSRNNTTNVFVKDLDRQGSSIQRTSRKSVLDFSYSPDGKYICFSEISGKMCQVFQTDASNGFVCRQITSGGYDMSPFYSNDNKRIYFTRQENNGYGIWSFDIDKNFLSSYTAGSNACPIPRSGSLICTRFNSEGRGEIWRVDITTGIEECIVSDAKKSFSTPNVSPDGEWLVFVGGSSIQEADFVYNNTDIYACRLNGTQLSQLTYHAADDLSPVWSKDSKYIYFISQRGSANATANIWRISFNY